MPIFNFVNRIGENEYELFCDHHMLSALRKCEAYFWESIIERNVRGRAWPFDFGIFIHACIEYMYGLPVQRVLAWQKEFKSTVVSKDTTATHCSAPELVDFGAALWNKMEFTKYHGQHKQYIAFGGFSGPAKLLLHYWQMYGETREPLTIVGTECAFGGSREVCIGEFTTSGKTVRCYYSGRIDLIVDDGTSLGVLDTKSTNKFSGTELTDFSPHDGMLGYVFALNHILKNKFQNVYNGRPCNRVIINHVQVSDTKDYKTRFKRTPITYSLEQIDAWQERQLRSFKKLFEITILGEKPDWNTELCSHWYYASSCPFQELHRHTPSAQDVIRKAQYIKLEPWSPYRK
jgi:PD-(D/E)XK nuclease superfamily